MFMKNKKIFASHTSYQIVDLNGHIISFRHARNLTYEDLLKSCDIGLSTVVVTKKLLKFMGGNHKETYMILLWIHIIGY